jgi:hypothetical protein
MTTTARTMHSILARERGFSDERDCLAIRINQFVERCNNWSYWSTRSDAENYVNGNIKFVFEHVRCGGPKRAQLLAWNVAIGPGDIPVEASECNVDQREIKDLAADNIAGKPCIISCWDQEPVFIDEVSLVDEIEKFVSSRFAMWLDEMERPVESHTSPMGQSLLYGITKPCPCFREGKLNRSSLGVVIGVGRNDVPIGVVECRPEVMDYVSADESGRIYDGFVLFGERGALAGLCICFDTVGERSIFAKQFDKISDVFRSPINL